MAHIDSFSVKPRKKWKKPAIIAAIAAACLLVAVYIIGLTLGNGASSGSVISDAVKENTQLKQDISIKDEEIARLQSEVESLQDRLSQVPAPAPEQAEAPEEVPEAQAEPEGEYIAPRGE